MNNKKILVIEDDSSIQELIVEFLSAEGYDVKSANDGLEGIQLFKKEKFDLVLLDVMMPNLDGYSVCKMIRQTSNVPIIFLTALNQESDEIKGFDLMCDDYITKPFSFTINLYPLLFTSTPKIFILLPRQYLI
jgi:two-component system response regulator VanR